MSVRCGNCQNHHERAADVRACYEHTRGQDTTVAPEDPWAGMAVPAEPDKNEPWWYGNGGKPLPFPPGRYAILTPWATDPEKLHFFIIDAPDEGKWAGYVFVKEQASDTLYSVKGRRGVQVIEEIAKDPREAMLQYGREIGKCGHCGRTLTDEESRAYGIGPICRNKVRFVGYEAAARG